MIEIGCAALYPITKYGFPYTLDNYLHAVAEMSEAGFSACELEINVDIDLEEYAARLGQVKDTLSVHGMSLSAVIGVVQQAFSLDEASADRTMDRFSHLCQVVGQLECPTVCICAYMPAEIQGVAGSEVYRGSPPMQVRTPLDFVWDRFWDNAVSRLAQMAHTAAEHGQSLVIENRVGDFVNTSDGVLKLVEDSGAPNAGCLLDVAHTHATKEHLSLVVPKLAKRLMYVHLADNDGSHSYHLPAGRGDIDFPALFRSLHAIGYQGFANVDFGGVPSDKIGEEVRRGRVYFTSCLQEIEE